MKPQPYLSRLAQAASRTNSDRMIDIFKSAIQKGASDIHIKAGDYLRARISGELVPLTQQRLAPEQIKQIALQLIPIPKDREQIDNITDYDCSWGAPGLGR